AELKAEDESGKPIKNVKAENPKTGSFVRLAEKYFEDALFLAAEQKTVDPVRALIKAVKDDPGGVVERGAIGGPKVVAQVIGPGQSHTWAFAFDTANMAAVGFQATAPLHCKMVNSNAHVYFNQTTAVGRYVWHPRQTDNFRAVMVT